MLFDTRTKQESRDRDHALYAWLTFEAEHGRSPRSPVELVEHLSLLNPFLKREVAKEVVERWWLPVLQHQTKSRLLVESAANAPQLPLPA